MAGETSTAIPSRREQLRDFLRIRRARLEPSDVGMVDVGRRRTPGLRREEVAMLAGVGVSWYTWLEQGRDINVSPDVLDAISRALKLSEPELAHLYALAGLNPPRVHDADSGQEITPELRQLIAAWEPHPAVLQDRYWNLPATNDAAKLVFGYEGDNQNCLVTFFTSPRYRAVRSHWESVAPHIVAAFRADAAQFPGDEGFARVVAELSAVSSEFAELWSRHDVSRRIQTVKAVKHPQVGELEFDSTSLAVSDRPDLTLVMYNPRPNTDTANRIERLIQRQAEV